MRTQGLFVAGLLCVTAVCPAGRAGLYLPAEPLPWPLPTNPREYLLDLQERQNVGSTDPQVKPGPLSTRVKKMVEALQDKKRSGSLTTEDVLNLGGGFILLGKHNEAIELMDPVARKEPKNFRLAGNLAIAYQGIGEYRRAYEYQQNALETWPGQHPGWTREQLRWYRRAEEYLRTLLLRRASEGAQGARDFHLDPIFPEATALGREGGFKPGQLDPKVAKHLPPDALAVVEQMLLSLPHDRRLLWLFAELVNGQGEMKLAEQFLSQLAREGLATDALKKHRQALLEAIATIETPPATEKKWFPDWRDLAIGFGAGIVFGILALLQLRQLFRG